MKKSILSYSLIAAVFALVFVSCEKEFDTPPGGTIPEGHLKTISDLRAILADSGVYKFTEDYSVYATVTADGVSGNFYKNFYIQDENDALNMRTVAPDGIYIGDYIRINLKNAIVSEYAGMLQLDSVDVDNQVVIQENLQFVTPMVTTINEVSPAIQGRLIQLENVEFIDGDLGQNYADPVGLQSVNRYVRDCDGNEIILRTSGYSSFAGTQLLGRNGTLTAIVGQFNDDMQLFIRDTDDVDFADLRCDGSTGEYVLFKNFEDESISSGGWTQQQVVGSDAWEPASFGGNVWAKVSNYDGSANNPSDSWLISPALDLAALSSPAMSFLTTTNYDGPVLQTYISTDYGSSMDVTTATWTELSATYSPTNGGWTDTPSGTIDLSSFISPNTYVAFRYTGSASDGATWELDNIAIFEN